ncbi:MAG: OmpH family outer membrane protein [Acidobacteriota bacterium]
MRNLKFFIFGAALSALFSLSGLAQTATVPPNALGKIGLINVAAFGDEKTGINKYKTGIAQVNKALEPITNQIKSLSARYQTALNEYQTMQKASPAPSASVVGSKADEVQSLQTQITRAQEDGKAQYNKAYSDIMSPIVNDVIKALNEFAKAKGYAVILDGAKLEEANILWGFDDRYDVTKEFIASYNARAAAGVPPAVPTQ